MELDCSYNCTRQSLFQPVTDTKISVDTGPVNLAATLSQIYAKRKEEQILTYGSSSLTDTEQLYSQTKRKAFGVIWADEHPQLYSYDETITVYNYYMPPVLIYDKPSCNPSAGINPWTLRLQPYQIKVKYRKGEIQNTAYRVMRTTEPPRQVGNRTKQNST